MPFFQALGGTDKHIFCNNNLSVIFTGFSYGLKLGRDSYANINESRAILFTVLNDIRPIYVLVKYSFRNNFFEQRLNIFRFKNSKINEVIYATRTLKAGMNL